MKLSETSPRFGIISANQGSNSSEINSLHFNSKFPSRNDPYRIAFYSHDTMGLGHVKRNILLAKSILKSDINCYILLISGSRQSSKFDLPYNAEMITLPSLYKNGSGHYTAKNMDIKTGELINMRSKILKAALKSFKPDIFIVDKVARGALKELDSSLYYLKHYEQAVCVLGLRDILDDPDVIKKEWAKYGYIKTIDKYYHYILVYGDKTVYNISKEYNFPQNIRQKIIYTGYLVKDKPLKNFTERRRKSSNFDLPNGRIVLCVLGGGQDGYEISKIFLKTKFPKNTFGVLLTGPFMGNKERIQIFQLAEKCPCTYVLSFVPDPAELFKKADRIIAMGGYNTVCELMCYGKKSLVIPRISPRKEQLIRAEYLSRLGLVDFLHPDKLSPESIAGWLTNNVISHPSSKASIDLNGISRIPSLLKKILKSAKNIQDDKELGQENYQVK